MLALAALPATGASATPLKAPPGLKFYSPPTKVIPGMHGTVIWSRTTTGFPALTSAGRNLTVMYRSRSVGGKPIAVSGMVSVPRGNAPKTGWPVIAWAHGTTGSADICAPSRDSASSPAHAYITYTTGEFNAWLKEGFAIVRTDYEGLGGPGHHPYLIGHSEGRGVLDNVRAARQLFPTIGKRMVIAGHSQGGQGALFAAADAPSWTPELQLRGVAAYAPASHLGTEIRARGALTSPGGGLSAIGGLILEGAATVSSAIHLKAILEPAAYKLVPQIDKVCLAQLGQPDSWGGIPPSKLIKDGANLTPLLNLVDRQNPALSIKAPVLLLQGTADTTVFPSFTTLLDGELVKLKDKVTYRMFPGVTHGGVVAAGNAVATMFFRSRFG